MDDFFSRALKALPIVASSPAALVAYLVTIAAYAYSAARVVRNRGLLKHLATLPEGDRLKALEIEMGQPAVTGGISAEQWLRAKIHRYYFLAFVVTTLTLILMVLLALKHKDGSVDIDVTGYGSSAEPSTPSPESRLASLLLPSANAAEFEFDKPTGKAPRGGPYHVRYTYERNDGKLSIRPESDLFNAMAHGEVIEGASYGHQPFSWDFPVLSVKVANNSPKTLLLSEVKIQVRKSTVDVRPVLVINSPSYLGILSFTNEGWGKVVEPKVEMTISAPDCKTTPVHVSRPLDTFDEYGKVAITNDVDPALRARLLSNDQPACVQGVLQYRDEVGQAHRYRFKTEVFLRVPDVGAARPPSYSYDVFLRAGKSGYVERRAISQEIKPGQVDHFLLRIATDRSCAFSLRIDINDSGGKSLWQGDIDLAAFVPRSGAALALSDLERRPAPPAQ
ncbi:MAG TPA: hypothetical protein VK539_28565 [Myxococcaceae bacterium]|nr:hypothetical protein [Myxococcaceae bacterium]